MIANKYRQVGDRIAVAPTDKNAVGLGEEFYIVGIDNNGDLLLNKAVQYDHTASFVPPQRDGNGIPALLTAEVINLSRNIVITGDDFKHVGCSNNLPEAVIGEQTSTQGCRCSSFRSQCTMGLHTAIMGGSARISNTRVERCGQRGKYIALYVSSRKYHLTFVHVIHTGIEGKYCLHFHKLDDCPSCSFKVRSLCNKMFLCPVLLTFSIRTMQLKGVISVVLLSIQHIHQLLKTMYYTM